MKPDAGIPVLHVPPEGAFKRGDSLRARLDDRQIAHLICVRLKHFLYDFFGGCLRPPSCCFL